MTERIKKEHIQQEAKELMDTFLKALEQLDVPETMIMNDKKTALRKPELSSGQIVEPNFRERMLENAPKHDLDYIITEKKTW